MELPDVFEHAHSLILPMIADGTLDGLRIDHVDGLLNPKEYLARLRERAGRTDFYLMVEKILAHHEKLRGDWPIDGTTGYEFVNLVLGLLIDPAGEEPFTRFYAEWAGQQQPLRDIVRDSKLQIMRNEMASELDVLGRVVARVARQNPGTADFTHNVLRRAIREVIACFPVYRTYVDSEGPAAKEDRRDLDWAIKQARANETDVDPSVFDFIYSLLSGDILGEGRVGYSRQAVLRCVRKLQQFSGPVMAKGLEDTAFYRYNRFIALNEVGGDPDRFGVSVAAFHHANEQRAKNWPHALIATSTHDTKRGEDTRARLAVLSEIPEEWARHVETWSRILRARRGDIFVAAPPDRNEEYLLYQLLVGTWPAECMAQAAIGAYLERLKGAVMKSLREAKVHTTWKSPHLEYEASVLSFVDEVAGSEAFLSAFLPFQQRVARLGVQNSLVQTALKLTVPGVPDFYQGSELWDLSMVDPDNRRPVDYRRREEMLGALRPVSLENWRDGAIKLLLTHKLLALRAENPGLFAHGSYQAAPVSSEYICGFERHFEGQSAIILAARFPARREADPTWNRTKIPVPRSGILRDELTGSELPLENLELDAADVFAKLPVAVLTYHD
jgi:(1->4)-alpha-D-glucan 1-alpha-D-glucosylmutase